MVERDARSFHHSTATMSARAGQITKRTTVPRSAVTNASRSRSGGRLRAIGENSCLSWLAGEVGPTFGLAEPRLKSPMLPFRAARRGIALCDLPDGANIHRHDAAAAGRLSRTRLLGELHGLVTSHAVGDAAEGHRRLLTGQVADVAGSAVEVPGLLLAIGGGGEPGVASAAGRLGSHAGGGHPSGHAGKADGEEHGEGRTIGHGKLLVSGWPKRRGTPESARASQGQNRPTPSSPRNPQKCSRHRPTSGCSDGRRHATSSHRSRKSVHLCRQLPARCPLSLHQRATLLPLRTDVVGAPATTRHVREPTPYWITAAPWQTQPYPVREEIRVELGLTPSVQF